MVQLKTAIRQRRLWPKIEQSLHTHIIKRGKYIPKLAPNNNSSLSAAQILTKMLTQFIQTASAFAMPVTDQDTASTSSDSYEDVLATAMAKLDTAQCIVARLQIALDVSKRAVEPEVAPDQEISEPDPKASIKFASLGIKTASKKKVAIQLERDVVVIQQKAGTLDGDAEKLFQIQNQHYFSAGSDLWRHQLSKMRLGGSSVKRLVNPCGSDISQSLMALYSLDELDKWRSRFPKKSKSKWRPWKGRDSRWRRDALAYYRGNYTDNHQNHEDAPRNAAWCHITGLWHPSNFHRAAHIVPSFFDDHVLGKLLFGEQTRSLRGAGNALLLSDRVKRWFDSFDIVVVPVNAKETPITRWRAEIVSPKLQKDKLVPGSLGKDVHGKELVFLNENRPVPCFLYFHFIMALIRIKDLQRLGWEIVWARYYEQRPFPTPSKYMRDSMLLALATHFGAIHMHVVESWIADHGFESPLKLTEDESVEAARRVHMVVVETAERAERLGIYEDRDDESETDSDLDSEEE